MLNHKIENVKIYILTREVFGNPSPQNFVKYFVNKNEEKLQLKTKNHHKSFNYYASKFEK
jgi:hypothetical protein